MPTSIKPTRLRCNYKVDPIGLGSTAPRLFWTLEGDKRGAAQTAYQIQVATDITALSQDNANLWDSGKVVSDQTSHVEYKGVALGSLQRAWWRVRVWDESGAASAPSVPAFWETGLLSPQDWKSEWIEDILVGGPRTTAPVPCFRKEFLVRFGLKSARIVSTALGLYELSLNGQQVGQDLLTPGWTDYRKRVQYRVYDVTKLLRNGANAVGFMLGDGWYSGHAGWRDRQIYGSHPKARVQLHLQYEDGSTEIIGTDESWHAEFGPILESDLLMGESYDARRELTGWNLPGYDDSSWRRARRANVTANIVPTIGPTVIATQEITPITVPTWPSHRYLFDLGQNMVGKIRLKVKGKRGDTLKLRFGERLDDKGNLYTENLRSARQTDYYTLKGDPEGETWETTFTFHGFQYVELTGLVEAIMEETVTGIVIHSDIPTTGNFECSDQLINQLQRNIDWGQRGNFVDIPTDCPQRDERLGWTGDAQVFIRTAAFNRDVAGFFTKWQNDLLDSQNEGGSIPSVAPDVEGIVGMDGGPAWSDAHVICPWTIYLVYGDTALLKEHYPSLVRFVDSLERRSIGFIRSHPDVEGFKGFGDWLSTNAETPIDLIGTAFLAYSSHLLAKIASVLGHEADAIKYNGFYNAAKRAFQDRFVDSEGRVLSGTQTANVLALHFDLLAPEDRPKALEALVKDIQERGNHLSTGFVGTPYISRVLSDNGYLDVAYTLLLQRTWPSWLYPVTKGATTIWERWDGWTDDKGFQDIGMNSFNHYAYGAIGAWLYAVVAGIEIDESNPAYKHIILQPRPGGGITWAKASLDSIHGRVSSYWRQEEFGFTWEVDVPPNTTATAYVPATSGQSVRVNGEIEGERLVDSVKFELLSGSYRFEVS